MLLLLFAMQQLKLSVGVMMLFAFVTALGACVKWWADPGPDHTLHCGHIRPHEYANKSCEYEDENEYLTYSYGFPRFTKKFTSFSPEPKAQRPAPAKP